MLHKNQKKAIEISLNNDFESGIHFHATGTGKSWIALELILEFNKRKKDVNIFWICERKSILIEQFSSKLLREKGYEEIFKNFQILNYSKKKQSDWYNSVNSSKYWNKSTLTIINRSFLTSNDKYKKINIDIDLIIHDECHTIVNNSTKEYYDYILKMNSKIKVLGFSATPNTNFEPFNKILSKYALDNSYSLIIQKKNIIIGKSDFDITTEILDIFNKEVKNVKLKN